MQNLVSILDQSFPLKRKDVGEFEKIKVNGMNFTIDQYYAKGLGNVSIMCAEGFLGLMKMDTLIINPTAVDLPLYSYDRIYAMGNDTLIVELYDTLLGKCELDRVNEVKAAYTDLPERDPGEHWYDSLKLDVSLSKKGKKQQQARFDELAVAHFRAYLAAPAQTAVSAEEKRRKKAELRAKITKAAAFAGGGALSIALLILNISKGKKKKK